MSDIQTSFRDLLECPVCLDIFIDPMNLSCGHSFCHVCILDWEESTSDARNQCPLCRSRIKFKAPNQILSRCIMVYVDGFLTPEEQEERQQEIGTRQTALNSRPSKFPFKVLLLFFLVILVLVEFVIVYVMMP